MLRNVPAPDSLFVSSGMLHGRMLFRSISRLPATFLGRHFQGKTHYRHNQQHM
jgi:hypothetical protein